MEIQPLTTKNISNDQRPNKRKRSQLDGQDDFLILYNVKLIATPRQIIKNGIVMPINSVQISKNEFDPPVLLEKLSQVQEHVLVYERGGKIYVRDAGWKKYNDERYNFLGTITDLKPLPSFLTEYVTMNIKVKTHNFNCVYGKGAHLFF